MDSTVTQLVVVGLFAVTENGLDIHEQKEKG